MIKVKDTIQIIKEGHQYQYAYCEVTSVGAEIHTRGRNSCFCFVKLPNGKEQRLIYPEDVKVYRNVKVFGNMETNPEKDLEREVEEKEDRRRRLRQSKRR